MNKLWNMTKEEARDELRRRGLSEADMLACLKEASVQKSFIWTCNGKSVLIEEGTYLLSAVAPRSRGKKA